jgi:hypothetical protein
MLQACSLLAACKSHIHAVLQADFHAQQPNLLTPADVAHADACRCVMSHAVLQADFLISLDAHYSDKAPGDEGLETFQAGRLMNTGVYYARARIQGAQNFCSRVGVLDGCCVTLPGIVAVCTFGPD